MAICEYCQGGVKRDHFTTKSGLMICPESERLSDIYITQRNRAIRYDELDLFVDKWKYLCPDINHQYDLDFTRKIFNNSLGFFTREVVQRSDRQHYCALVYPLILTILDCIVNGQWIGDPEQKLKCSTETEAFYALFRANRIHVGVEGFISII